MSEWPNRDALNEVSSNRIAPFEYAYRYPDGIRCGTHGRTINGSDPIETIPLYTEAQMREQIATAERRARLEEAKWWLAVVRDVANDAGIEPTRCSEHIAYLEACQKMKNATG